MTIQAIGGLSTASIQATKKEKSTNKGSLKAFLVGNVAQAVTMPVSLLSMTGIRKVPQKMTPEQIEIMNKAADEILQSTGLAAKGVKIDNVRYAGLNLTGLPDSILDMINQYSAIANGKNAAFSPKALKDIISGTVLHEANTVLINREKLPTAIFHELGHAFNYNKSAFWRVMQQMRLPAMLISTAFMIYSAITKNSEPKEGQELTKGQKVNNFIRKNSGFLATGAMLPVILEETMASIRGGKWASANLAKDLAKKVKLSNMFGALSYVAAALGVGVAAYAATKIKDKSVEKAKQKQAEKLIETKA